MTCRHYEVRYNVFLPSCRAVDGVRVVLARGLSDHCPCCGDNVSIRKAGVLQRSKARKSVGFIGEL